jgi:hypothetical protein
MSRAGLIEAFRRRGGVRPALVPLIGLHAARLEQVDQRQYLADPEMQARALRNAQALYETDAVTIGASLDVLATAARLAVRGGDDLIAARADSAPLARTPDVAAVVGQAMVQAELETIRRLRPVLNDRAGVALVLPTPGTLQEQLGGQTDRTWCMSLIMSVLRLMGSAEPDVMIAIGDDDPGPRVVTLCNHFGIRCVVVGLTPPQGVAATTGDQFINIALDAAADKPWLYTSITEVPMDTDPKAVRASIDRIRSL